MSNPIAKAERSKAKDLRQGITQQKERFSRSKKTRPVAIMAKLVKPIWAIRDGKEWYRFGSYRTAEEAEKVIADCHRKYPGFYEFKIVIKERTE